MEMWESSAKFDLCRVKEGQQNLCPIQTFSICFDTFCSFLYMYICLSLKNLKAKDFCNNMWLLNGPFQMIEKRDYLELIQMVIAIAAH